MKIKKMNNKNISSQLIKNNKFPNYNKKKLKIYIKQINHLFKVMFIMKKLITSRLIKKEHLNLKIIIN